MIDPAPTGRELQRGELVNYPPLMSPATRIGVGSTRPLGYSDHLVNCHDPGVSSVTCHPVRSEGMSLRLGALAVVFSVAFHAVGVHAQAGSAPWGVVAQPVGSVAVQDSGGTRSVSQAIADYRKLKKRHAPVVDVWLALDSLGQFDDPRIVDLAIEEFESEDIERYATARQLIGGLATADSLNRVLTLGVGHEEARVRAQVILALGEGQPTALDWITPVEAALDDGVAMVRAAAVEALGRARDSGSLDRILQLA